MLEEEDDSQGLYKNNRSVTSKLSHAYTLKARNLKEYFPNQYSTAQKG